MDFTGIDKRFFRLTDEFPVLGWMVSAQKSQPMRFDMHYELELGVMLSGRMRRTYDGWETVLGPGDAWMCGMWEPHGYEIVSGKVRHLVLVILPQMLVNLRFDESPDLNFMSPFVAPPGRRPEILRNRRAEAIALARKMEDALESKGPNQGIYIRLRLVELLMAIMEGWTPPKSGLTAPPNAYSRINAAVERVFRGTAPVRVQDAARECSMSRNRFSELFRSLMGISFAEFSARHRLAGAARQMAASDDAPKTVARDWGFTDASHLHRCFMKYYGCTPSQYRKGKKIERHG
jgi:AraC-like DNA-binding protein